MKVLIAGATGVLGRRMVKQFLERGHDVVGLARSDKAKRSVDSLGARGLVADIFDADSIAKAVGQADIVTHAATSIPVKAKTTLADWAMNDRLRREGTRALTEASHKLGARTYIQQSIVWAARPEDDSFFDETTKVEKPGELYRSALEGENIALETCGKHGFNVAVLRCGGFYSADARHTRMLAEGLIKRRLPLIGGGKAVQANIHVEDAANAFVTAAEAGKSGLWHVTDDTPATLKDMLTEFARLLQAPPPRSFPLWLARIFVGKGVIDFFTRSTRTSNSRFREDFGWSPRFPSYREGLKEIVAEWNLDSTNKVEKVK
jgi:nucleoside-diphosphate-sugar epimerase